MERNSRKLIKMLEDEGWTLVRVRGDHHNFKKAGERQVVTVPHPNKDLPENLVRRIYQIAGWRR